MYNYEMNSIENSQKRDLLKILPYFSDLTEQELEKIGLGMNLVRFSIGDLMTKQGGQDSQVYFVAQGLVRIYLVTEAGKEKTLALVGPESILGEVAAVTGQERTAYAEALTEVTALKVGRADFVGLVRNDSDLALNVIRGLSERLRRSTGTIEESMSFKLQDRLMLVLKKIAEQLGSIEIDISHEELARITGAGRARVTETLNEMQQEGKVSIGRRSIILKETSFTTLED